MTANLWLDGNSFTPTNIRFFDFLEFLKTLKYIFKPEKFTVVVDGFIANNNKIMTNWHKQFAEKFNLITIKDILDKYGFDLEIAVKEKLNLIMKMKDDSSKNVIITEDKSIINGVSNDIEIIIPYKNSNHHRKNNIKILEDYVYYPAILKFLYKQAKANNQKQRIKRLEKFFNVASKLDIEPKYVAEMLSIIANQAEQYHLWADKLVVIYYLSSLTQEEFVKWCEEENIDIDGAEIYNLVEWLERTGIVSLPLLYKIYLISDSPFLKENIEKAIDNIKKAYIHHKPDLSIKDKIIPFWKDFYNLLEEKSLKYEEANKLDEITKEKQKLLKEIESLQNKIDELKKLQKRKDITPQRRDNLNKDISKLDKTIKKLEYEINELEKRKNQLKITKKEFIDNKKRLKEEIKLLNKEKDYLEKEIKKLQTDKNILENERDILLKEREKLLKWHNEFKELEKDAKFLIEEKEKLKDKYEYYQAVIKDKPLEIKELEKEVEKLEPDAIYLKERYNFLLEKISDYREIIEKLGPEVKNMEKKKQEAEKIQNRYIELSQLKDKLENDYKDYSVKVKNLQIEKENLDNEVNEKSSKSSVLENEVNNLKQKVAKLEEQLVNFTEQKGEFNIRIEELTLSIKEYKSMFKNLELNFLIEKIERIENELIQIIKDG